MELIYRYDPFQPTGVTQPADAAAAASLLLSGNRRLAQLVSEMQSVALHGTSGSQTVVPLDLVSMGLPLLSGASVDQRPFALVLGCSDARVPIERVFDQAFNNLFVVRIAGNVLGTECLGSFDYAVRHLADSLKLVVVLGHTGCGAVSAAVDAYLDPNDYSDIAFTHALRSLIDRVMIAVRGAARALDAICGEAFRSGSDYRTALIETAVYLNSAITAFDLWREAQAMGRGDLRVMYGVFDLTTMVVRAAPSNAAGKKSMRSGLGNAPQHAEEFTRLASELARQAGVC